MLKKICSMFLAGLFFFSCSAVFAAELTVSAAASLKNAFEELAPVFEKKYPGVKINLNFAASNPLLRQIVEGAPVDVFASADQSTMDKAQEAKVVDSSTRKNFAANDLVFIVPKGSAKPANVEGLQKMQKIAVGNPDSVPAGRYAKQSLESAKLWDKLNDRYVLGSSVRQTLDYVARGETDGGIVYGTDARQMKDKVDVALILGGHTPVTYPVAVATTGKNQKDAKAFIDLLLSKQGQEILQKYGFAKP